MDTVADRAGDAAREGAGDAREHSIQADPEDVRSEAVAVAVAEHSVETLADHTAEAISDHAVEAVAECSAVAVS